MAQSENSHSDFSVENAKACATAISDCRAEGAYGMARSDPTLKTRSRNEIMHYVLLLCVSRIFDSKDAEAEHPRTSGGRSGFVSTSNDTPAQVGDLVLLEAAPASKWQIGWLVETRERPHGDTDYLIESLEDGSLCWWTDVGICFLQRKNVRPEWRWTNRQWEFKDRWFRICRKGKGADMVRPIGPAFGEGYEVTIGTRNSHGFDDIRPTRSFPDYRKVTMAMMAQCYDECVAERDRIVAERKAIAETV